MFHIILLLLKIVGIILLVVLGILLLILACVLFVPLRYKGDVSYIESPSLSCKIKWMFPLFFGKIQYDTETKIVLRVLGIPVFCSERKKKENKKAERNKNAGKNKKSVKNSELDKERKSGDSKETETTDKGNRTERNQKTESHQEIEIKEKTEKTEKKSILDFLKNIWYTIKAICAKLKQGRETIERYIALWRSEEMVNSRSIVWQEVLYLLRTLKPQSIKGSLEFGFDDPSLTGYGMAVYGIFYSVWGKNVEVRPDFENHCLKALLSIKGKIRVFPFVKVLCKLYFNQDVRKSFAQIKKEI